ncbi:MAG: hypothetical protein GF384_02505 [Elusimicrobia bacterium]|nr:hypothetical protein [Elusimicrobiota bacterium]
MKHSLKTGLSFGITSGVITTLGLMVGLYAGTKSRMVVIGGILTIAIADSFSDALGIHVSEESELKHTSKEIWLSTLATFVSKFMVSASFLLPVFFLSQNHAVIVGVLWAITLLGFFSFYIARQQKTQPIGVIIEHLVIAMVVVFITHVIGRWVNTTFY